MFEDRKYCTDLTSADIDSTVLLAGWAESVRDLGGISFIKMRDVSGIVQVVVDASASDECSKTAAGIGSEYCILVVGKVRTRAEDAINKDMKTGEIEVAAERLEVLNASELPPFPIGARETVGEDLRLRYRYLDLRREEMQEALVQRHRLMQAVRKYLSGNRFFEIETPMLNKSTPEGARDFLVPSRINPGFFYALPQSPQLFKQILMISGFDRYFQIVKCFRDEDLRYDRQPEFTQIDLELSFVTPDMVMNVINGLISDIVREVLGREVELPIKKILYDEAMSRFGSDAPDMRFGLELVECSDIFSDTKFKVFSNALSANGCIKCIAVSEEGKFSRKIIEGYGEYAGTYGAKGLPWVRVKEGSLEGGISKFLSDAEKESLLKRLALTDDAVILFGCDSASIVNNSLGNVRVKIAKDMGIINDDELNFVWVTDFPLFEYSDEDKRYYSTHHPFTAPRPEQVELLDSLSPDNVNSIKAQAYDIVLNGVEIGGGSIRINNPGVQGKLLSLLGISEEEAKVKFGFLIEALTYGAPPHGGIALGLDRIIMLLLKRKSIRDVIPFPKTQRGQCLMSQAPSPVTDEQLQELSIKTVIK